MDVVRHRITLLIYEFFARVAPGVLQGELTRVSRAVTVLLVRHESVFSCLCPYTATDRPTSGSSWRCAIAALASLFVALGCLLLGTTDNLIVMGLGRYLQGLDSTVAYLGVIYFLLIWLPPQRHDMVPGMVTAIGTLGAATAQLPLLVISERFGWRMPLRPARLQE